MDKFGVKENEKPNIIRSTMDLLAAYGPLLKRPLKRGWNSLMKRINNLRDTIVENKNVTEEMASTDKEGMKELNRKKQRDFLNELRSEESHSVETKRYQGTRDLTKDRIKSNDDLDR